MKQLTRDNVSVHCRTCLKSLIELDYDVGQEISQQRFMKNYLKINWKLQQMLNKYLQSELLVNLNGLPEYLCFLCYKKFKGFERFLRRVAVCINILHDILKKDSTKDATEMNNSDNHIFQLISPTIDTEIKAITEFEDAKKYTSTDFENFTFTTKMKRTTNEQKETKGSYAFIEYSQQNFSNKPETMGYRQDQYQLGETVVVHCEKELCHIDEMENSFDIDVDEKLGRIRPCNTEVEIEIMDNIGQEVTTPLTIDYLTDSEYDNCHVNEKALISNMKNNKSNIVHNHKGKDKNSRFKFKFNCSACYRSFVHEYTYKAHIRKVHEGSKTPYQCDRCDKSYAHFGSLYTHVKDNHNSEQKIFHCDHPGCDRVYASLTAVRNHKRRMHSNSSRKFVCEQCGLSFGLLGNLKNHRLYMHPTEAELAKRAEQRFECEICKKNFCEKKYLNYHTLQQHSTNSQDLRYECNICGRRMARKFMLRSHMRSHNQEEISCEICNKKLRNNSQLKIHMDSIHFNLKPFQCVKCLRYFATKKYLQVHNAKNSCGKQYNCDICDVVCTNLISMRIHKNSHTKFANQAKTLCKQSI